MARDATALNQSNPITEDQVEDFCEIILIS